MGGCVIVGGGGATVGEGVTGVGGSVGVGWGEGKAVGSGVCVGVGVGAGDGLLLGGVVAVARGLRSRADESVGRTDVRVGVALVGRVGKVEGLDVQLTRSSRLSGRAVGMWRPEREPRMLSLASWLGV
ncbi:MAG: hypothetical protein PVI63_08455 [Anaerolineae bacterium]